MKNCCGRVSGNGHAFSSLPGVGWLIKHADHTLGIDALHAGHVKRVVQRPPKRELENIVEGIQTIFIARQGVEPAPERVFEIARRRPTFINGGSGHPCGD